ncbi:hypothetical protein Tdes44962_MAKER06821 [Teratosphaeria destructans]|uniref:NUC153 domain-containing protein n=1 Tax=Teratosphaeria destructans TaxID=418781 RepID=A0A9W7T0S9_9PEZI|nr:hypothetical protein Tdes44962_MAKER06821 [Teratosphaeria destructans]
MVDERFSALSQDPRYRLPSRKEARTAVDPRFGRLFSDQDFRRKASVDRYGRKIKPEKQKNELERLYRLEQEKPIPKPEAVEREVVGSSDEGSEEEDGSEEEEAVKKRDPAREGGFSESDSDEDDSSDDDESDDEAELAEETAGQEQTESIPMGEVSRQIAAVNLDWDNIRASDLMAVARSFAPAGGRIERVTIYPSEFGRERLDREELEGPPREIFASSSRQQDDEEDSDEDSDDEDEDERIKKQLLQDQAKEGDEFDTAKLRQYQLERLRYYYAVIECDSQATAKTLYDSMDGREYLSTSNFFDLRFIPGEVSFDDDKPKEECIKLPSGYKPNDFRTEALTHSKARLTWDDDDTTRKEAQKRAFSRAEIDENDLQAYIGSDDSDADSTTSRKSSAAEKKAAKKEAERAKMRAALGLGDASTMKAKKKDEPVGDMQITFTSGLGGSKAGASKGVFENEPQDEESTRARYIRKEKERRQQRKERAKAGRTAGEHDQQSADEDAAAGAEEAEEEDLGFNDPFFDDPKAAAASEKKARKAEKQAKRAVKDAQKAEAEARKKDLELLMTTDGHDDDVRHFDMREIEKAEKDARKKKGRKGKKGKKEGETDGGDDGFEVDAQDPRFRQVLESHEYAIDPTNPRFKKTKGMSRLLEEGRKKRKGGFEEAEEMEGDGKRRSGKKAKVEGNDAKGADELKGLVARLKSKKSRL